MLYIERDVEGKIKEIHVSTERLEDAKLELVGEPTEEVLTFIRSSYGQDITDALLPQTDLPLLRVIEDLTHLLIKKHVISFTELPDDAQTKLLQRQILRQAIEGNTDVFMGEGKKGPQDGGTLF